MGGLGTDGAFPADDFLAELGRWAAGERTARAAADRVRRRSLTDQSLATSTWTGLLVDLAEAGADVVLSAGPGLRCSGRLVGVAQDFVVVEQAGRGPALVRTAALDAVTADQAEPVGGLARGGGRRPPSDLTFAAALEAMAGERAPVRVQLTGQTIVGAITACGEDVVSLKLDGAGRPVYVAVGAVVWIEIR